MAVAVADDDEDDKDEMRVVKMSLMAFCKDSTRIQIKARIQRLVEVANKASAEAYLFANFHVIRCLDDPMFDVTTLPQLDRNFYYRCLIAVSVSNVRAGTLSTAMETSRTAFDALRPLGYEKADIRPYNQMIADLSIKMAAMASNSVWANIERFLFRYLRLKFPELKKALWKKIVMAVVKNPKFPLAQIFGSSGHESTRAAICVAENLRAELPIPSGQPFSSRSHIAMRLFHTILAELNNTSAVAEKTLDDKRTTNVRKARLFNLLPRKGGFTISSVDVSSMTFMKLLSMGDSPLETVKGDGRNEDHGRLWRKYFNVTGAETRSARFDNRIVTDGKSVSILRMVKACCADGVVRERSQFPADCEAADCRCADSCTLKVGVDPGMTDIVTVMSSDRKLSSVSSAQFSEKAGYKTSRRRTDRWTKETAQLVSSIPSSKVASLQSMEAHIRGYLSVLPQLLQHRAKKGFRSMRFLRYVGRQKAIEMVCDVVAPKDRFVVVGFGNWNNQGHGITRQCSGPIRDIRMALKRRNNVCFKNIAENYTSCRCSNCFERLINMKADSTLYKMVDGKREKEVKRDTRVHKVLHCRNSVGSAPSNERCGTTWNRDVNAAKNILLLLKKWISGQQRPEVFCWAPKQKTNTDSSRGIEVIVPVARPIDGVGRARCYPVGLFF